MFIVMETTTDSKEVAKNISTKILDKKLSPCIQIHKIESRYIWHNKLCDEKEYLIKLKTIVKNKKSVVKIIKDLSNYDIPEIISFEINIDNEDYGKWFIESYN